MLLNNQDSLIINVSRRNELVSKIFCMEMIIKVRKHLKLPFWFGVARCVCHLIRFQDSLIINISQKGKLISQILAWRKSSRKYSICFFFSSCVASFVFRLMKLQGCLIINISKKNQLRSYIFSVEMKVTSKRSTYLP